MIGHVNRCVECPWRLDSKFIGFGADGTREKFLEEVKLNNGHTCHMSLANPGGNVIGTKGRECKGAKTYLSQVDSRL